MTDIVMNIKHWFDEEVKIIKMSNSNSVNIVNIHTNEKSPMEIKFLVPPEGSSCVFQLLASIFDDLSTRLICWGRQNERADATCFGILTL